MSPRGAGYLFGADVALQFAHANGLDLIARAHQLVLEGYKLMFENTIVTVWSAPNYCYRCGNVASILKLDEALNSKYETFDAAAQESELAEDLVQAWRWWPSCARPLILCPLQASPSPQNARRQSTFSSLFLGALLSPLFVASRSASHCNTRRLPPSQPLYAMQPLRSHSLSPGSTRARRRVCCESSRLGSSSSRTATSFAIASSRRFQLSLSSPGGTPGKSKSCTAGTAACSSVVAVVPARSAAGRAPKRMEEHSSIVARLVDE